MDDQKPAGPLPNVGPQPRKRGNPNIGRLASKGGKARMANRLTAGRVARELPAICSPETCQEALNVIMQWVASGLLSGVAGGVCVRAAEAWLKQETVRQDRDTIRDLEERVAEYERQLAEYRAAGLRAV